MRRAEGQHTALRQQSPKYSCKYKWVNASETSEEQHRNVAFSTSLSSPVPHHMAALRLCSATGMQDRLYTWIFSPTCVVETVETELE